MKHVMKFKHQDKEGFLSFVEKDQFHYALVEKDTPKVKEIQLTNRLYISHELKTPVYREVVAEVIYDQPLIEWVYRQLESEKNLYFKELNDQLCVIRLPKNTL